MIRYNVREDVKWKRDAERFMDTVEESFFDSERNFRRWFALEKCVFRSPVTGEYIAVTIGDDAEAIYHFLLFCRKLNCREDLDETFREYLQYLINKSMDDCTEINFRGKNLF